MNADIEILDNLMKQAAKLALTPDPEKRIVASRWEIFFRKELGNERLKQQQLELVSVVDHDDDLPHAVSFSQKSTASEGGQE